jgi:hypothetical protein
LHEPVKEILSPNRSIYSILKKKNNNIKILFKILDRHVKGENTMLKEKSAQLQEEIEILTTKNKRLFKHARKWYKITRC